MNLHCTEAQKTFTFEIRYRVDSFNTQYGYKTPRLYLHYILSIDVTNVNVNSDIDIELVLSYYIWLKTFPRSRHSDTSSDDSSDHEFLHRCNQTKHKKNFKEYMKIDINHAEYWRKQQFTTACPWKQLDLCEYHHEFRWYEDDLDLNILHPIHHHYSYNDDYHETIIMSAEDPMGFRNPYNIDAETLIHGYIKQYTESQDVIIPTDIVRILIKYFDDTNKKIFFNHNKPRCVYLYKMGQYTCGPAHETFVDDIMMNSLFLLKMVRSGIERWYCLRYSKEVRPIFRDGLRQIKTYFFAKFKSNDKDRLQFMVTVLADSQLVPDDSSSEESSSS